MLYLTCATISSVDLANYGISRAKDWVSVDCGTSAKAYSSNLSMSPRFQNSDTLSTKATLLIAVMFSDEPLCHVQMGIYSIVTAGFADTPIMW